MLMISLSYDQVPHSLPGSSLHHPPNKTFTVETEVYNSLPLFDAFVTKTNNSFIHTINRNPTHTIKCRIRFSPLFFTNHFYYKHTQIIFWKCQPITRFRDIQVGVYSQYGYDHLWINRAIDKSLQGKSTTNKWGQQKLNTTAFHYI